MLINECTKVQNPRRPRVRESLNTCANAGKARAIETQGWLCTYTAGSAIALTGAVSMLVLPHAVTAGASLYIEQEYLIAGKPE